MVRLTNDEQGLIIQRYNHGGRNVNDDLEYRIDDAVQSIGRGIKTFAMPMPWGTAMIAAGSALADDVYADRLRAESSPGLSVSL